MKYCLLFLTIFNFSKIALAGCGLHFSAYGDSYGISTFNIYLDNGPVIVSGKKQFLLQVYGSVGCNGKIENFRFERNDSLIYADSLKKFSRTFHLTEIPGDYVFSAVWNSESLRYNCVWKFSLLVKLPATQDSTNRDTASAAISSIVQEQNPEFLIFPNPAQNHLTLLNETEEIKNVKIYGLNGKLYNSIEINSTRADIPLENYPAGIYIIQVAILSDKIVVKRLSVL